jgi:hypothetical protein
VSIGTLHTKGVESAFYHLLIFINVVMAQNVIKNNVGKLIKKVFVGTLYDDKLTFFVIEADCCCRTLLGTCLMMLLILLRSAAFDDETELIMLSDDKMDNFVGQLVFTLHGSVLNRNINFR